MYQKLFLLLVAIPTVIVELEATCIDEPLHHIFYKNNSVNAEAVCPVAHSCKEWKEWLGDGDTGVNKSGIYPVDPDGQGTFQVYCDMETDGGGWTVFQRRQDGSVDFYRGWVGYEMGFGELDNEFWLGLGKIHRLTKTSSSLRVDLEDFSQNTRYAHYNTFSVGDVSTKYVLTIGEYSGTAGDCTNAGSRHNGKKFSTKDNDNDDYSGGNCAVLYFGGWWYDRCHYCNLNGKYLGGAHSSYADGVEWYPWTGYHYSLKFTEMKIRENN